MRKLVSIQKIKAVEAIPEATSIELVRVLGWKCVAKKGEFKAGDLCVYFEVDSFLPITDKRYEFLKKTSYRNNEIMGEGYKVRTQKFMGHLSQGLALPLGLFPELKDKTEIDTDVSDILGVVKWEMPEILGSDGTIIGKKPYGIPTTDETRVQSIDKLRTQLLNKPYYISTKMDGTSCSIYCINGKIGVCGRENEYKNDGKSVMWNYMIKCGVFGKLLSLNKNIVIQGEFCGPKIQKNRLQLKDYEWYVFNVFDADTMNLYSLSEMLKICKDLSLNHVPIEEVKKSFNYTLDELLERAKGKYPSGQNKEGIVVRPQTPEFCSLLCKSLSFKVLNNDFLLKEK